MNTAMQSFGYGLAALLFCIAILGVCHNIKKAEAFEAMEQVRLAVNLHSRPLLIQKRRSHKNAVEAISRLHLI